MNFSCLTKIQYFLLILLSEKLKCSVDTEKSLHDQLVFGEKKNEKAIEIARNIYKCKVDTINVNSIRHSR